jgi:hypothetical protein
MYAQKSIFKGKEITDSTYLKKDSILNIFFKNSNYEISSYKLVTLNEITKKVSLLKKNKEKFSFTNYDIFYDEKSDYQVVKSEEKFNLDGNNTSHKKYISCFRSKEKYNDGKYKFIIYIIDN